MRVGKQLTATSYRPLEVYLAVALAYLLLTTPSPPLLRSALMAAAFCLAVILGRQISTANIRRKSIAAD